MKLFDAQHIGEWDEYTMKHEPIPSIDLMERAAKIYVAWLKQYIGRTDELHIICGPGNNGGDGLVIARLLANEFYRVSVYLCHISSNFSEDNRNNQNRLPDCLEMIHIEEGDALPRWTGEEILIDAVFGSGLSRPVKGYWGDLIRAMNNSGCLQIAVDVPSGLYADQAPEGTIVRADRTLSFERPKRSFLHRESEKFAGLWEFASIGLHPEFPSSHQTDYHYLTHEETGSKLNRRPKFSHKGSWGHALLLCGSTGMLGAAQLAGRACQRAGAGKVTLHLPASGIVPLQTAVPEIMVSPDPHEDEISALPEHSEYDVVATGCGIGQSRRTKQVLLKLLDTRSSGLILDADALNILAETEDWEHLLPTESVLTPHPGECDRLFGTSKNSFDRLEKVRDFARKYEQTVVLKGAYCRIVDSSGTVFYNSSGNPGLATAGSGDVLTGMITGWMAQGYAPAEACMIAVHQHGKASDLLDDEMMQESITAGDLIEKISQVFKKL